MRQSGVVMIEKRVLVVDDNDAIRSTLVAVLRRRGLIADSARDGVEALEFLDLCSYSLMLLDSTMPRLDGAGVLRHLRTLEPARRPFVLVLTAGNESRDLDPFLVAGTVRKPFDIEVLLDTVAACISAVPGQPQRDRCPPAPEAPEPSSGIS